MVVPSAEVTVLMGSTFLAVVLRQTKETEETDRQRGLVRAPDFRRELRLTAVFLMSRAQGPRLGLCCVTRVLCQSLRSRRMACATGSSRAASRAWSMASCSSSCRTQWPTDQEGWRAARRAVLAG